VNSCSNSATSNIVVDPCTGIQQPTINSQQVDIYPNPTNSIITLSGGEKGSIVTIYNVLGEVILSQEISNDKTEIDVSSETNGIYFLRITSEYGSITKRIVKQ
jgi:hypothetical protein